MSEFGDEMIARVKRSKAKAKRHRDNWKRCANDWKQRALQLQRLCAEAAAAVNKYMGMTCVSYYGASLASELEAAGRGELKAQRGKRVAPCFLFHRTRG